MNLDLPVSSIMTTELITVSEDEGLSSVLSTFKAKNIRHIPVVKDKKVRGIVSRTDINRLTFSAMIDDEESSDEPILNMLSLRQIMTAKPKTVLSTDSIREVARLLSSSEYHALPVEEGGKLVGIVTTTDLLCYMLGE
jgi:CBS domain-containing protein